MKKILPVLLALLLASPALPCALAEEGYEYGKVPEAALKFDSVWVSEDAGRVQTFREDGSLKVMIQRMAEYPDGFQWEYGTDYDEATGTLRSTYGIKFAIAWDEDGSGGSEITDTLYEDGAATFEISGDGKLLWHDAKEDAGKGAAYTKIGRYDGTKWVSGRASIEMYWEEEGYKVFIHWGGSASEAAEWSYSCYYDAETDSMSEAGFGLKEEVTYAPDGTVSEWKTVYEDGSATFYTDAEGYLIWKDEKEGAGDGMRFELAGD